MDHKETVKENKIIMHIGDKLVFFDMTRDHGKQTCIASCSSHEKKTAREGLQWLIRRYPKTLILKVKSN